MSQGLAEPSDGPSELKSPKRIIFVIAVAAIIVCAAAFVLWVTSEPAEPELNVYVGALNFYIAPPSDGKILWAIMIDLVNNEDDAVTVDPCDLLVETSDGVLHHFAWRVGDLTVIQIGVTLIPHGNITGMGADLPPSTVGLIQPPYELPDDTYPVRVIWKSALGDIASNDFGLMGQERLADYAEMTTGA